MTWQELYLLQSVGDLYDLKVIFPQTTSDESTSTSSSAVGGSAPRRAYSPGHGEVGPRGPGNGEMLECSAMIKIERDTKSSGAGNLDNPVGGDGQDGEPKSSWRRRLASLAAHHVAADGTDLHSPDSSRESKSEGPDFWAGHTTWRPYYAMLRTWKIYDLPWSKTGPVVVSSSPGLVGYSKDDW